MRLVHGATDESGQGEANDDFQCEDPALGLFAVASGAAGGWVVSRTAIRALRQHIVESETGIDVTWPCSLMPSLSYNANRLRAAVIVASRSVDDARTPPLQLAAVLRSDTSVAASIVGDCRVYLARAGRLQNLRPAPVRPSAAIAPDAVAVFVCEVEADSDDRWLICSPGICNGLTDEEIASVVMDAGAAASALGPRLIDLAATRQVTSAAAIVVSQSDEGRCDSSLRTTGDNPRTLRRKEGVDDGQDS